MDGTNLWPAQGLWELLTVILDVFDGLGTVKVGLLHCLLCQPLPFGF